MSARVNGDSVALARVRRDLLRVLAGLFLGPPEPVVMTALTDPAARGAVEALLGSEARDPLEALARPRRWEDRRQEYFETLAVPGVRYKPPFESVYCDVREVDGGLVGGLLLGPSCEAVRAEYAAEGFEVGVPELPDHLGCALAFLSELCGREAAALQVGDGDAARRAAQRAARFAAEHPARWVDGWAARLDGGDGYLRPLARLTSLLVHHLAARRPLPLSLS